MRGGRVGSPGRNCPRGGALALLLFAVGGCQEPDPVVLGVAATESFVNGARLAVEDAFEGEEGLPGFDTVMVEDWSNRADTALQVAGMLVEEPGMAAVVGHSNSTASLAASQLYNHHRVVQVAPTSTAPLYSEAGAFSFRMVPPDHVQGRVLAETLAADFPEGAAVALLYVNDDYGRGLRRGVLEHLDGERFPVVLELPHLQEDVEGVVSRLPPGNPDREGLGRQEFDTERVAETVRDVDADVLVWLGRPEGLNHLLPDLQRQDSDLPVYGGDALSRVTLMPDVAPEWEGVRYLDFLDVEGSLELRDFRERYEARFGEPAGAPEALAYDATRVLLQAIREGARTGPEVRGHLEALGRSAPAYAGITGSVRFTHQGDGERGYVVVDVEPEAIR